MHSEFGTSDDYFCSNCNRQIDQSEIDDDASEAFEHVCKDCAEKERSKDE